jgi:hypothetical protein
MAIHLKSGGRGGDPVQLRQGLRRQCQLVSTTIFPPAAFSSITRCASIRRDDPPAVRD